MADNLVFKIIKEHLVSGDFSGEGEIGIRVDQTLTQDATGTIAYLQLESMGLDKVRTELSVSYIDHNTLQSGFENADDHRYLQSVAANYGIWFSRPGNGICHQVHLERFGVPGKTLLGSDSHTPTAGGLGMLGIGAGGLDVAVAMAGGPFYLSLPKVIKVNLVGELPSWVGAKDIILELLRRLSVKGGVGKVIEYGGPGIDHLSVRDRSTITNMGAELGATSSIFPSDEVTLDFLRKQGREEVWKPLAPESGAHYDEEITIDLSSLEPLVAIPHSPDAVKKISEVEPIAVDQVAVGSCTNGSYSDLRLLAAIMGDNVIHPGVSLVVSPGSRQTYLTLAREGVMEKLVSSGARILESACGPCIGMGQAPSSGGVSVRTFNRNFRGRSGTADAQVYLAGPAVAAVAALKGFLTDPREIGSYPDLPDESPPVIDDRMLIPPRKENDPPVEVLRGPNIKPLPLNKPLPENLKVRVALIVGDNITTDDITPGGSKVLPLRSNIQALSEYVFDALDSSFTDRAKEFKSSIIIAGDNYGQGSSREHAALAPMFLGVKAVVAKSFARIHHSNLVNYGIIPLVFKNPGDHERFNIGDLLVIDDVYAQLSGGNTVIIRAESGSEIEIGHNLSERQIEIIRVGGLLNLTRGDKR
ncbi:MAG: aconitate hydratase [Bacillota bacterium]|nr:aconitate hydratase [Bacillota bacterium]